MEMLNDFVSSARKKTIVNGYKGNSGKLGFKCDHYKKVEYINNDALKVLYCTLRIYKFCTSKINQVWIKNI